MSILDRLLWRRPHACPPGACFTFDNFLRKALQNPRKILASFALEGKTVLDIGPGKGYFTIPLARMVGDAGRVVAADIQPAMLKALAKRARRAGMSERIRIHLSREDGLGVPKAADFALMFWMAHEVPDKGRLFREIRAILKPGGRILLVEPRIHVTGQKFEETVALAEEAGFAVLDRPTIRLSRAVVLGADSPRS
ncbi:MAG: class I SAM-dependent methyltransferase [Candidatus Aminicenantales bacterium]